MDIENELNEESEGDDDEFYHQKELEIALYSQIHFEPNTDSFTHDFSDLPYNITVEGNDRSGFLSSKTTSDMMLHEMLKEKYADDQQWDSRIKKVHSDRNRTSEHVCDKIKQEVVVQKTGIEKKLTTKHKSIILKNARQKQDKLDSEISLAEKLILGHSSVSDSDDNITINASDDDDDDDGDEDTGYRRESARLKNENKIKKTVSSDGNDDRNSENSSRVEKLRLGHSSESESYINITISDDDDNYNDNDIGYRKETARFIDKDKLIELSTDDDSNGTVRKTSCPVEELIHELSSGSDCDTNFTISDDDDDADVEYIKENAWLKDEDEFMEALTEDSENDESDDLNLEDGLTEKSYIQSNVVGGRLLISGTSESDDNTDPEDWKILHADTKTVKQSRYFKPVVCFNCKERGHISNACPKPKKQVICNLCSGVGHISRSCPETYCSTCLELGHSFRECKMRKYKLDLLCHRCHMEGHEAQKCPDQWRQFHQTVEPGMLVRGKPRKISRHSCYNCGGDDHLGHECVEERPNRFVRLTTPFVCKYHLHKLHKASMLMEFRGDQTELGENPRKKRKTEHQSFQQKNVRATGVGQKRHTDSEFVGKHNQVSRKTFNSKPAEVTRQSPSLPIKQKKSQLKKSNMSNSMKKSFKDNRDEKESGKVEIRTSFGTKRNKVRDKRNKEKKKKKGLKPQECDEVGNRALFGSEIHRSGGKTNTGKKKKKGWTSHKKITDKVGKRTSLGGEIGNSGRNRKNKSKLLKSHDNSPVTGTFKEGHMIKSMPSTGFVKTSRGFKTKLKVRNQAEMVFTERKELNNPKISLRKPFKGAVKHQGNALKDKNMIGNDRNNGGKGNHNRLSKNKKRN